MKTVIVDDHALIRSGVTSALAASDFPVVAEASSSGEALAMINTHSPDFAIIDLNLAQESGFDLINKIMATGNKCRCIVLTMQDDQESLDIARTAGAVAFVTKSAPITQLLEILESLAAGVEKFMIIGEIKPVILKKDFQLTKREVQILNLLPSGATAYAIGGVLFLTQATVKTHLANIYRKLSAANRAQAVAIAKDNNLITK